MWRIRNPELRPATLNFSSSGQGKPQVSQLFSEGTELINAIELVDWDPENTQLLVCEACGFAKCKRGDWVSIRRSGQLILFLPSTEYIWSEDRGDRDEYAPPGYLEKRGVAYFDLSTYQRLRAEHASFPPIEQIRQLSMREAALLFQLDAPARVLGTPPEVKVRHDVFIGASEGDSEEHLRQLENLVRGHYEDECKASVRDISVEDRIISLYLDAEEFIEWRALAFDGSAYRLMVDSTYVIDTAA